MESKHYTFEPPQKFFENALTKRHKRLKRNFRLKSRKSKISPKLPYIVPFLFFFQILVKNWKNNQFPSSTSFLVPNKRFTRLENRFWRKFEKSTLGGQFWSYFGTTLFEHLYFPCFWMDLQTIYDG